MSYIEQSGYDYNTRVSSKSLKMQKAFLLTGLIKFYNDEVMINGGPLHIILEDGNFDKHSIKVCRDHADPDDYITNEILNLMEIFTERELERIVETPKAIKYFFNGCRLDDF